VGHMRIRLRSRLADIGGFGHPRVGLHSAPVGAPLRTGSHVWCRLVRHPETRLPECGPPRGEGWTGRNLSGRSADAGAHCVWRLVDRGPDEDCVVPCGDDEVVRAVVPHREGVFVAAGSQVMVTRCDAAGSRNTLVKPHEPLRRLLPAGDVQVHLRDLRTGDGPGVGHREGHLNGPGPVVHRARQTHLGQLEGGVRQAEPDRTASTIAAIAERSPPRSSSAPSSMSPATPASASIHACRGTADGVC
jgi:hypothetical protein